MKLADISKTDLSNRLKNEGIRLRIGPFVILLNTRIEALSSALKLLYGESELAIDGGFSDFHISLDAPAGLRGYYRPQVLFYFDGQVPFKPLPITHAFPLFEWGLNWCIAKYVHQYLILHAAVLEKNNRSIIMPGPPGSGKSTLCAALALRGWRLLSDEMALVGLEDLSLTPVTRPVALKNESIDIIQRFESDAVLGPLSYDTSKGTVAHLQPPVDSMSRYLEKSGVSYIVMPRYSPESSNEVREMQQSSMLKELIRNSFNYNILREEGFRTACRLVDACGCFTLDFNNLDDALTSMDRVIHNSVNE
ncbi:MAG TPA: HprK-related kinase A [Gammaproteobacteria bacterium]|nr:HprK-related kinase A [Gammaproteobacteria bacterium]